MVWNCKTKVHAILFCFVVLLWSCKFDEPVREYFEYWSSTCQVGKIEYASENIVIDNIPNLSASDFIELNLFMINPKNFKLLLNPSGGHSFSFQNESGNLYVSDYSETMVDPTYMKIRAKLSDESEGQTITLSGCLWPENRTSFSEADLKSQSPELFYSTTFIQNTPPDNIRNMQVVKQMLGGKNAYLSFEPPDQSLNRNKDSTYEIKCYLRESDGNLYYKGSKILSLADNRNPDAGSNVFFYYFDEQVDNFTSYEYTAQVTGPHGLKAELLSTDPSLGVSVLVEPTVNVLDAFNGLSDDQGFECIEVPTNESQISFTVSGQEGDSLSVSVDNVSASPNAGIYTVSGIGQHTVRVESSRLNAVSVAVEKRIRIVKKPDEAVIDFGSDFNGFEDAGGFKYIEIDSDDSTVAYEIRTDEEGTTVTANVDGTTSEGQKNGSLSVGPHTLTATVHKEFCNDRELSAPKKIMVAKQVQAPSFEFNLPVKSGSDGYRYIEVPTQNGTVNCTIKPSTQDAGAKVSGNIGGTDFSPSAQIDMALPIEIYDLSVTVAKDCMTPRVFNEKIKVVKALSKPTISITSSPNGKEADGFEYYETTATSIGYNILNNESDANLSIKINGVDGSNTGSLSVGNEYTIVATVSKQNLTDAQETKKIRVVKKLSKPTITISAQSNGNVENEFVYYEVDSGGSIPYSVSKNDSDANLSVKINDVDKNTSGSLAPGEYTIVATVTKSNVTPAQETKKIRVVESLSKPTYSCAYLNGQSLDGFECIEIPANQSTASYKISTAQHCTITGKDNSVDFSSGTSNEITLTLGLGKHTISGTVNRTNYNSKSFEKKVIVVQEIQKPTIRYKKDSIDGSQAESDTCEDSSYSSYSTYNIELAANGTGSLYFVATPKNGETIKVKDGSTEISTNGVGSLSLGPHTLTYTLSKTGYTPQEFVEQVYVQGILSAPTISYSGDLKGYSDTSNNARYEFSYLNYAQMSFTVSAGNTGETTVEVYVDGSPKTSADWMLDPDTDPTVKVVQTRQYCKKKETEESLEVRIKPVTVAVSTCQLCCNIDDDGDECEIAGRVLIGMNGGYFDLRRFGSNSTYTNFKKNTWDTFKKDREWSDKFTKTSDYVCYGSEGMYEYNVVLSNTEIAEVKKEIALSTLAASKRSGSDIKIEVTSSDGRLSHRIYLTLTE